MNTEGIFFAITVSSVAGRAGGIAAISSIAGRAGGIAAISSIAGRAGGIAAVSSIAGRAGGVAISSVSRAVVVAASYPVSGRPAIVVAGSITRRA